MIWKEVGLHQSSFQASTFNMFYNYNATNDNVMVARNDEPTENHLLNLQLSLACG